MNMIYNFAKKAYNLSSMWEKNGKKSFTITFVLIFLYLSLTFSFKILEVFI